MRSLFSTFLLCTVVGLLAFGGVYFWKKNQIDHHHEHLSAFEWFCEEFDVGVEHQRKIEALHLAYFPECEDHCIHYADTKQTLARMNEDPGLDLPEHAAAAKQLTELKKEADKKFIDFIYSVAAEMKSDSSERYLQRMKGWLEKTAKIAAE